MNKRIIIIGAGPTGIGAAYRLADIGHTNFAIYEKNNYIGGLSASFKDAQGYTHDIGGHVLFSHYPYFDMAVEKSLNGHYVEHQREAWIFGYGKTIPYPFQNNIRHLNKDMLWECIEGLLKLTPNLSPQNFGEWIDCTFGVGIGKYFMHPYNLKVWAYPTDLMAHHWISERVSVINLEKILKNVIYEIDEKSWGPNNLFKFPLYGGTQAIFSGMIAGFQDKLH